MPAIVIYLLKSIACSGLLYSYYRIAFYNRINHQWNRFFLLATLVVCLLLPLVKVYVPGEASPASSQVVRLMNVVATNDMPADESSVPQTQIFNASWILVAVYISISLGFIFLLVRSLARISRIYRSCPKEKFNGVKLVMTEESDAPFSFLKTIFWNTRINRQSPSGSLIFEHEMEHVRQLHSLDRLFMNIVLAIFWCNPFFWLIRKELVVVHEFMSDQKALRNNDTRLFSEMVLLSAFPGRNFSVTSTFFNSSIKRRLTMLTTLKNSSTSLWGKWLMLPVILVLFTGFSLRKKEFLLATNVSSFVVMIDAGHGGSQNGVTASDGTMEKDLNLSIARKIKELNTNERIKIVMTREGDEDVPLRQRVEIARKMGVDAFLSIHINSGASERSGFELMITKNINPQVEKSQLLGSLLSQELNKVYKVDGQLKKGRDNGEGVWVLDAPEINYPSLLIECGNMSNSEDLKFIKSGENQEKIAKQILSAISQFANGVAQAAPAGIEILVEEGRIVFDLHGNKVVRTDFSELKSFSSKNIFVGDDLKSNGSEAVIVDGIYLGKNTKEVKRLELGRNKKLIVISTKGQEPLAMLLQ